jgi:hypothetical protein
MVVSISLAIFIAGCSTLELRTAPARVDVCDDALASGRLVVDPETGLALSDATGRRTGVLWPYGYSARRDLTSVALLDNTGHTANVLAREGDFITISGGTGSDGLFAACAGSVQVVAAKP